MISSANVTKNDVFVTAPNNFQGALPVRHDITVLPSPVIRIGWVVYEEQGVTVINDRISSRRLRCGVMWRKRGKYGNGKRY